MSNPDRENNRPDPRRRPPGPRTPQLRGVAGGVRSTVGETSSGHRVVNAESLRSCKDKIERDRRMCPSKRVLLLANLEDQSRIAENELQIRQIGNGGVFDHNQTQRWDPSLRSQHQRGFFSLDDATDSGAIVDFAHDKFGGGVLGPRGFAQEEKLLLETNLVTAAGEFTGLSRDPLCVQALRTHQFVGRGTKLYGNSELGSRGPDTIDKANISADNVHQFLQRLTPPTEINLLAMAALDMKSNRWTRYTVENCRQMFETARKAFVAHAESGGRIVHSGAWGAGVFGNSENVTCVLQILAAQAAGVQLMYHGSDQAHDSAVRFLAGKRIVGQSYETVFDSLVNYMQTRHRNRKFWQPQIRR